jgi:hypothetical protein
VKSGRGGGDGCSAGAEEEDDDEEEEDNEGRRGNADESWCRMDGKGESSKAAAEEKRLRRDRSASCCFCSRRMISE